MSKIHGQHRTQRGELLPNKCQAEMLQLGHRGLDKSTRRTKIQFSMPPQWRSDMTVHNICAGNGV